MYNEKMSGLHALIHRNRNLEKIEGVDIMDDSSTTNCGRCEDRGEARKT